MNMQYFKIMLGDELWPGVSCGQRIVEAKIGHKWVRVREAVAWSTNRKRVSRKIWDTLKAKPVPKPKNT